MNAAIGGEQTCLRASELDGEGAADAPLFNDATKEDFFLETSNDVASVIESMSALYERDSSQVMILVSDLMIPTEDGCVKAAAAIKNTFLTPRDATVGIIGILGDFRGTIENLPANPRTGTARKISDYMVAQREADGAFRHPLYILFMGNDRDVLLAMEKALTELDTCGLLDHTNPVHALYFSEYGVSRREKDDISLTFTMGHETYSAANYDVRYVVRGVANDSGTIDYESVKAVPADYQQLLKSLNIVKLYTEARGNAEKNVTLCCTVPFTLTDSSKKGDSVTDKHRLLISAKDVELSNKDYSVSVDIRVMQYQQKVGAPPTAEWVVPDASLVRCESRTLNVDKGTIELVLTVDTNQIPLDEPLFVSAGVHVCIDPDWEEVETLYDIGWIADMTLNLKAFEQEASRQDTSSSARYTYATTAKTPFLSSLFVSGICDQQIEIMLDAIRAETNACAQTAIFGFVVRDIPQNYLQKSGVKSTYDFGGWAFSYEEALGINNDFGNKN
jgi:hypothetical protein